MTIGFARARRLVARLLVVCLIAGVVLAAAACPRAGHFLIVDETIRPADAIVVLAGTRVERWLEAAELYRERNARRDPARPGNGRGCRAPAA